MGKLKSLAITSDPVPAVSDFKVDDLAGQLLMQLFYGKTLSLPTAPSDDELNKDSEEINVEDAKQTDDADDYFDDFREDYYDDEYDSCYFDTYEDQAEQYMNEMAQFSSKRLLSSHNTNYYENKLRSKSKWKQEKVNPDRCQNACRAKAKEYRETMYQAHDLSNRKDNSARGVSYRTINYVGGGCSSSYSAPSSTKSNNRASPPSNYNENEALNRALQESQQEHLLRSTATSTGLSLAQLRDLQNREFSPEDYEMLLLLDKQIAPKCLTLAQVKALPCKILSEDDVIAHQDSPCMVCLCEFETQERIRTLRCGHIFHDECVTQWLTGSSTVCPTCKSAVC